LDRLFITRKSGVLITVENNKEKKKGEEMARTQINKAEGKNYKEFFQLSVRVDSWDDVPCELIRAFGEENENGEKWLIDMPINY